MITKQVVTALGAGDPDDGDEGRQLRGMAIASLVNITRNRFGYEVPSQSGNGSYVVSLDGDPYCTCPDFKKRGRPCKHIYAVRMMAPHLKDGQAEIGPVPDPPRAKRKTYGQDWPAYNAAQVNEKDHFLKLLRELCNTVPLPPSVGIGRPRLPISDVLYACAVKVYTGLSGRRSMSDVREAAEKGYISAMPTFNSTFRYMQFPGTAPLLRTLVQRSALPLRGVETAFAVDSSGFSSSVYDRWYDKKYGKVREETKWVKAHLVCGVKTNIVPDAWVTPTNANDAPFLKPLIETTARKFKVKEVSADKAYLSKSNLQAIEDLGAAAYIPFKSNSVLHNAHQKFDPLWAKLYHYYHLNQAEFAERYHQRSNVESTYHMIKAKFGGNVRSRVPTAQVNEALLKVLCHNIVVIVQSAYELGGDHLLDLLASKGFAEAEDAPKPSPGPLAASQLAWKLD